MTLWDDLAKMVTGGGGAPPPTGRLPDSGPRAFEIAQAQTRSGVGLNDWRGQITEQHRQDVTPGENAYARSQMAQQGLTPHPVEQQGQAQRLATLISWLQSQTGGR